VNATLALLGAAVLVGGKPAPAQFLHVDAVHKTAVLTLVAGYTSANNGFNFDGYGRGELLVSVPRGWRVTVHCRNASALRNSCVVVTGAAASVPAFPGASTPDPVVGLGSGSAATFSFTATRTGSYRFTSLVAGHEAARMWDVLEVRSRGRPAISARSGP
jgi:Sulfocyanin (SoxE) domain